MILTFTSTVKAEDKLQVMGFKWTHDNAECYHEDGRQAAMVDYGHKCVVTIW